MFHFYTEVVFCRFLGRYRNGTLSTSIILSTIWIILSIAKFRQSLTQWRHRNVTIFRTLFSHNRKNIRLKSIFNIGKFIENKPFYLPFFQSLQPLIDTLKALATNKTTIIMSYEERDTPKKIELQKEFFKVREKFFEI